MDAEPTAPDTGRPPIGHGGGAHEWRPDVLDGGFRCLRLPLPEDEQATLIAYDPAAGTPLSAIDRDTWSTLEDSMPRDLLDDVAVLYLHGWSDYFYHAHLARFWSHMGADFYALDLRGYGRNLDPDRVEKAHAPRSEDDDHVQRPGTSRTSGSTTQISKPRSQSSRRPLLGGGSSCQATPPGA